MISISRINENYLKAGKPKHYSLEGLNVLTFDEFGNQIRKIDSMEERDFELLVLKELIKTGEVLKPKFNTLETADLPNDLKDLHIVDKVTKYKEVLYRSIVSKDELRPSIAGVYHSNGYAYATDAFVLVKSKNQYDETNEGSIINRVGFKVDAKYPNADGVIPNVEGLTPKKVNTLNALRVATSLVNLYKNFESGRYYATEISIGDKTYCFNTEFLIKLLNAALVDGHEYLDWYLVEGYGGRLVLKSGDEFTGLIMEIKAPNAHDFFSVYNTLHNKSINLKKDVVC